MTAAGALRKYIIPLLAAAIAISVYMRSGGETAKTAAVLGFTPEGGQVVRSEDTHGGCHGDGHRFIVMDFGAEDGCALAARLEASETWSSPTACAKARVRPGRSSRGAAGALCFPR